MNDGGFGGTGTVHPTLPIACMSQTLGPLVLVEQVAIGFAVFQVGAGRAVGDDFGPAIGVGRAGIAAGIVNPVNAEIAFRVEQAAEREMRADRDRGEIRGDFLGVLYPGRVEDVVDGDVVGFAVGV